MALVAYRHLLRSTRIAFQGDAAILHASRTTARQGFDRSRSLDPDSSEAVAAIQHAEDVAKVLRHNIVQGERVDGEDQNKLRLRIHQDIERGDNDTVKLPDGQKVQVQSACS